MTRQQAYDHGRELFDEWLDANLCLIKRSVYTNRFQLHVVREMGAGYLLSKLAQDPATAYDHLKDFLTGHNVPKPALF